MGTRNLTIVRLDGKVMVSQYGQWDGYPTGEGETVAEFIDKKMDLERFKGKVKAVKKITEKERKSRWVECGADPKSDMVGFDVSDIHRKRYPEGSRDTGADVLWLIQERPKGIKLSLEPTTGKFMDRCDAEYAYDIDFNKKTVSVWVGNKKFGIYSFKEFDKYNMDSLEREINKAQENNRFPKKPRTKIKITDRPKDE